NGTLLQTEKSTIALNLKNGNNYLKVYTELQCQGSFDKTIFLSKDPIVFPNPVDNTAKIFLGSQEKGVELLLYTVSGEFLRSERKIVNGTQTELDMTG